MHTLAVTENYIIIPENSYLKDPCAFLKDTFEPGFLRDMTFEPQVNGRFLVVNKNTTEVMILEADHAFFITHSFGSYEAAKDVIYVDVIKYNDASAYIDNPKVQESIYGQKYGQNYITRFELYLNNMTVVTKVLHDQAPNSYVEFSNINWAYGGKKYRCTVLVKAFF